MRIRLRLNGDFAEVDVIDNGKGFPETNRHQLLEPYITTRSDGTGLGLPIVAKIVEDHGGGSNCSTRRRAGRLRAPA